MSQETPSVKKSALEKLALTGGTSHWRTKGVLLVWPKASAIWLKSRRVYSSCHSEKSKGRYIFLLRFSRDIEVV